VTLERYWSDIKRLEIRKTLTLIHVPEEKGQVATDCPWHDGSFIDTEPLASGRLHLLCHL